MTDPRFLSPPAFVKETGLTRQTFYNCLKQLKKLGIVSPECKQIDMTMPWMVNYMKGAGTGQRKAMPATAASPSSSSAQDVRSFVAIGKPGTEGDVFSLPDMAHLIHLEQYEKVRKAQITNESSLNNLFARSLVQSLVDNIDDFFIKLIIDGESSLVPKIVDKAKSPGALLEDCKKIYRQEMTKRIKSVKNSIILSYKKMTDEK